MVCVDTNFLVALERRNGDAVKKLKELADSGETLYVSSVSVAEFFRGAYSSANREKALKEARGLLGLFAVLSLDYEAGRLWGELSTVMRESPIDDRDMFIACICLSNRQSILTKNLRHFSRVPGLVADDW